MYDVWQIRKDFPILQHTVNDRPVAFLDTAASAQKPRQVLDKMRMVYETAYANAHRGSYTFAEEITTEFEAARQTVQKFLNAKEPREIVFTRNATESINLVAATWAMQNLRSGDEILISQAEHHANLVPWQNVCAKTGAKLVVFPIADDGSYLNDEFEKHLNNYNVIHINMVNFIKRRKQKVYFYLLKN